MKKIMIMLAMAGVACATSAQKDPVSSVFEKYSGKEGFTTVNISGDMLNMMSQVEQQRRDTTFRTKLSDLRVLVRENKCGDAPVADFRSEVYDKLDKNAYKEMISVKENDKDVLILVRESEGIISELLLLVTGKDENVVIQAKGNILLKEIAEMTGNYHMKGFEKLRELEKKN